MTTDLRANPRLLARMALAATIALGSAAHGATQPEHAAWAGQDSTSPGLGTLRLRGVGPTWAERAVAPQSTSPGLGTLGQGAQLLAWASPANMEDGVSPWPISSNNPVAPVPEPATWWLMSAGLLAAWRLAARARLKPLP